MKKIHYNIVVSIYQKDEKMFLAGIAPLGVLVLIGFFIFIIIMIMKEKTLSLLNLYLLVISIVGIIGIAVGYGILAYTLIENSLITDKEYLVKNYYGTYDSCEDTTKAVPTTGTGEAVPTKTQKEIDDCKIKRDESEITRRHLNSKESMIGGGVWGSIFLILFATHFPLFLKKNKEVAEVK